MERQRAVTSELLTPSTDCQGSGPPAPAGRYRGPPEGGCQSFAGRLVPGWVGRHGEICSPGASSFVGTTFDPAVVGKLLDAHSSGDRNEQPRIWTLLSVEVWHRGTRQQAELLAGVTLTAAIRRVPARRPGVTGRPSSRPAIEPRSIVRPVIGSASSNRPPIRAVQRPVCANSGITSRKPCLELAGALEPWTLRVRVALVVSGVVNFLAPVRNANRSQKGGH